MSTKINARSPFYLSYSEPPVPEPTFTCGYANARNFSVDQTGAISLPVLDYGYIQSFTSDASDFSNGKFAEVSSDTLRTLKLTILAPSGFSNEGDAIICEVTFTQPLKPVACSTVVTLVGSIPSQSLDSGGNSVTVDYSSYFGGSSASFSDIIVSNDSNLDVSLNTTDEEITISSKSIAGVFQTQLERIDSSTGCSATQTISTTVTAVATFDCNTANLLGGNVASDGTLTTPSTIGTVTDTKETSGGASVTSIAANNTGSSISVTLYYDILVPNGYTNSGSTIECSVTYTQLSDIVIPTFSCSNVDLDNQAILEDGNVVAGEAKYYSDSGREYLTIQSFTPTSFSSVDEVTNRDVTFTIEVPSGFTNTGSTIDCVETLKQPADSTLIADTDFCTGKTVRWYFAGKILDDPARFQYKYPLTDSLFVSNLVGIPSSSSWVGETLCQGGKVFGTGSGRYWLTINQTRRSYSQAQAATNEYWLFMNGEIVQAVYLRDWNSRAFIRV